MRVVFRVDASARIGTGHVMRCLTLADALKERGHECLFICRAHPGHLAELIRGKGYVLTLLPAVSDNAANDNTAGVDSYEQWLGVSWQDDAAQTLGALGSHRVDWLVVDHYGLDARWQQQVTSAVGQIFVLDDLADRPHDCSLLLDQNLGRRASDYDNMLPEGCRRLIGPRFALLRPEFLQMRERSLKRREHPELRRILISMGGIDRHNVTGEILHLLAEKGLPAGVELDIVMGSRAPHLSSVREQVSLMPCRAVVNVDVQNMSERMCLADLSIGAAGGTSWERCCLGLPAALVILAENQVAGATALQEAGAARILPDTASLAQTLPPLLDQLSDCDQLRKMSKAAASITEGEGVRLTVEALMMTSGRSDAER